MQHTKKYIVCLLAAIMLVSGCGCEKEGKSKAPAGNVAELEKKEKNLLADVETAFISYYKLIYPSLSDYNLRCSFKKIYTHLECNSFVAKWNDVKTFLEKTEKTGYEKLDDLRLSALNVIGNMKVESHCNEQAKAEETYLKKKLLELYRNRLAMIDCMLGIQPESSDQKS